MLVKEWQEMVDFICSQCHRKFPITRFQYNCDCGNSLELIKNVTFPLEKILQRRHTLWRYQEAIPIENKENIVSFGEGMTPLVDFLYKDFNLKVKIDFLFPSGSYKDRGATVLISKLKEIGVESIIEDSSGNAGAAIACYSAKAKIKCEIYCPESTSEGKIAQIQLYGAKVRKIPGTRADTSHAILENAKKYYYASHNWNPFFLEGTKTVAYEIADQLNWNSPDAVICPVGFGSIYLGLYIGFKELFEKKVIKKLPKLLGVQSNTCCPIYKAYIKKSDNILKYTQKNQTLAEGICSEKPIRNNLILNALKETNGSFVTVSENEIIKGTKSLASQGLYVEPTSAFVLPAIYKFYDNNIINPNQTVVIILTGSGLKSTEKIAKLFH